MHSGDTCERDGVYQTASCCQSELKLPKGAKFPVCPGCGKAAVWVMTQPVVGDAQESQ